MQLKVKVVVKNCAQVVKLYFLESVVLILLIYYPNRAPLSQTAGLLVFSRISKNRVGGRFQLSDSCSWNRLPVWLQETDTLTTFKMGLQLSFSFNKAYI